MKRVDLKIEFRTTHGKIITHRHFIYFFSLLNRCINGSKVSNTQSIYLIILSFLFLADNENLVIIHCNSGKGRAGTACVCLLLYIGLYDNIAECAKLFGARRFTDNKGVSQPCQVRFIHYFEAYFKRSIVKSPQLKVIKKIRITGIPGSSVKPYFQIY